MRSLHFHPIVPLLLVAALSACAGEEAPPAADEETEIYETETPVEDTAGASRAGVATEYASDLNVNLEEMTATPTGLRYEEVTQGTGEPAAAGDTVSVHYTGWLPDGTTFDSSRDRGEPFQFVLGEGRVIPGWDEGVAGMLEGGTRKLVIPPALGYGEAGAGATIPPHATLVFEVELLEVR